MNYRIGVDVGGSFTDFAILESKTGSLKTLKVFSRPDAPGEEIKLALDRLSRDGGLETRMVERFVHGTTVGINTVIQRVGPKIALITTKNFEDVLEIARLKIPHIHNLHAKRPTPLISRECVFGVDERVQSDGTVLVEPDEQELERLASKLMSLGVKTIVIALLNAYRNGENERKIAQAFSKLSPDIFVVTSSETWPIIREYERTLTTVMSGYVNDRVSFYLDRFETTLTDLGIKAPILITKSNGGVMALDQARREPVHMLLSGTASGVVGAGYIARESGFDKVLTLDIGGTSADVALLLEGQAQHGVGELVGDFPLHMPSVAVSSVGQGGGSVAWVDDLGVLQVGPESAGSTPGPVCYGRGGVKPTVTDAMVLQNLIGHGTLGYGAVTIDKDAAQKAILPIVEKMKRSAEHVAASIIDISVSSMYAEVQALISRFGIDPREFYIMAFGGGGPMLAAYLARDLNVAGVVVPPRPGVVSALGSLVADLRNDFITTLFLELTAETVERLVTPLQTMRKMGREWLVAQNYDGAPLFEIYADMRYRGQSYEIETPLEHAWIEHQACESIRSAFHQEHEKLFGHCDRYADIQVINLRLVVVGQADVPNITVVFSFWFDNVPLRRFLSVFVSTGAILE